MSKNKKPDVCVIVSGSSPRSRSSTHLGAYLGANLALSGHVRVSLVSLPAGPNSKAKNHGPYVLKEPLLVTEHRTGKRVKVQDDLDLNAPPSVLSSACIVVVCVDSADTPQCLKLLTDHRATGAQPADAQKHDKTNNKDGQKKAVGIISLQRGVKNSAQFADAFANDRSVTVLEGAVGLEVVRDPVDGCVLCLNPKASLVVERLNRDKAETGNVMVDILETTGVRVLFRHNLTTHSWGITTLHTCVGAVIALTGQPMAQGLRSCGSTRLLCAALLRECRLTLGAAARDGKWAPCMESCTPLSLLWLERLFTLPSPLYTLLAMLCLPLRPNLPSVAQADLHEGLESDVVQSLRDLQALAQQYAPKNSSATCNMPVLSGVLQRLSDMAAREEGVKPHDPAALYRELGSPSASRREGAKLFVQVTSGLCLLLTLIWLLWR